MADLIDREELKNALIHQGVYSELVRRVLREAPNVDDTATALIRAMGADLERMGKLNESLRIANNLLSRENQELKERLKEVDNDSN